MADWHLYSPWTMELGDESRQRRRRTDEAPDDQEHTGAGEATCQGHHEHVHDRPTRSPSMPASSRGGVTGRPSCTNDHSAPANSAPIAISTICPVTLSYGDMNVGENTSSTTASPKVITTSARDEA